MVSGYGSDWDLMFIDTNDLQYIAYEFLMQNSISSRPSVSEWQFALF